MEPEIEFMRRAFARYYDSSSVDIPYRFGRREFGFIMFEGGFFKRHMAFEKSGQLQNFMRNAVPRHAYYSTAYYRRPNGAKMADKGWMGADLIFDLDADHIAGAERMTYPEMLAAVKKQFVKLVDDFLNLDFGFDYKDIEIVFSGGRGYHAHIADERVIRLQSHERREIVDYITGVGLDLDRVLEKDAAEVAKYKEHRKIIDVYRLAPKDAGGWKGKISRSIGELLLEMKEMGEKEWVSMMRAEVEEIGKEQVARMSGAKNMGKGTFESLYRELFTKGKYRRILEEGNLNIFRSEKQKDLFLFLMLRMLKLSLEGETDEPVTSDIKRLIRLPGSLHGKSALRVIELDRERLDDFNPVVDAIPDIFREREVKILLKSDTVQPIGEEAGNKLYAGEMTAPLYLALFLMGRKMAVLSGAHSHTVINE